MSDLRTPTASAMRRALRRARDGVSLDVAEAAVLLHARDDDLDDLAASAARVRDAGLAQAGRPGLVTYSRNVFVPLTRLCRDRCHYCGFATVPARLAADGREPYLSTDEVLAIARQGAALGCREALFTLGDRPEARWGVAAQWLASRGYASTLDYLRAMAVLVLEETGLLPHLNPGVMSWEEIARCKPVAASMGLMLETSSRRLFESPGQAHAGSPDKDPDVRLRVLHDAGRQSVPFTTGLLVGIGETAQERAETIHALRAVHRSYGAVQEVIVQNFRAKPGTPMRDSPDADAQEYRAAVAVTRLVMGPGVRVQAPPNLSAPDELAALLAAGVDDWGGVSPLTDDHVNPERPWPGLADLAEATTRAGFSLVERLAVHPEYVRAGEPWIDPRLRPHVQALAASSGLAAPAARPRGLPWQDPDPPPPHAPPNPPPHAPPHPPPHAADLDGTAVSGASMRPFRHDHGGRGWDEGLAAALRAAERDPAGLSDAQYLTLAEADGAALGALADLADRVRADTVGDVVTYVVNRNINVTNVCYTGCRFCAFAQRRGDADAFTLSLDEVADRSAEAWALGATEVCMQGGIDPSMPASGYADLVRAVLSRAPQIHVHAFSPMEIVTGAARTGMPVADYLVSLREVGLGSIPGTAAEILDDEVRWVLTRGKLPAATWAEVVTAAHRAGLRSSATMMFGHVDDPRHWVAHLRVLRRIQEQTGGFTEFVPLPFVHQNAPIYLAGLARPGPTERDTIAVHALARLMLHGRVDNIQTSWVKLGLDGARVMLRSGANDLGGTLMEESISRMAGSGHGSWRTPADLDETAAGIGRPTRIRTTLYEPATPERVEAARAVRTYDGATAGQAWNGRALGHQEETA